VLGEKSEENIGTQKGKQYNVLGEKSKENIVTELENAS
jgi:hypothetical protein